MTSSETRLAAVEAYIERFYEIFETSPFMLGKPHELNTLLYYIDHLRHITKYGEDFPQDLSWVTFLSEKEYLNGDKDVLADCVRDTASPDVLHELRREYAAWFESKSGRNFF
jgi:hypothetical protein